MFAKNQEKPPNVLVIAKLLQYYYPWLTTENVVLWSFGNQSRTYLQKDDIIYECSISMPSHAEKEFWCIRFLHEKQNFPSTWYSFYVSSEQFVHTCTHLCRDTMFWCFVYCWRGLFSHTNTTVCLDLQPPQITFLWRNYWQKHAQWCLFVSATSVLHYCRPPNLLLLTRTCIFSPVHDKTSA